MSNEKYGLVSCDHCGQEIEFPLEGVGMRVPCPQCNAEIILGLPPISGAMDEITAAELQAALSGAMERPHISAFYQVGLFLVAVFMLLLPVAYFSFVTALGYCTYWYARHAPGFLFSGHVGGFYVLAMKVILYVGPVLGGAVAVFFMFKPIFAPRRKQAEPVELNPAQHPRLYQFIAHLSDLLHVSMPKRIYLDCSLNASVGFRQGWLSFLGSDLVLNIGLPLVAGLNTRQFAAVVGHELGHCTQSFAMRLGYVIDSIDRWFMRVVYERDTWDDGLEEWANSVEDSRLSLVVACVGIAVWLSRKILMLLMMAGHAASCFLSRQMEFHADACAMAVAGSGGLESLLIRLREQAVLESLAYNRLNQIWNGRRQLPDSLPDYLDQLERGLPTEFHEKARLTLLNETCGWFSTHPTAAQRIQQARQRAETGVFEIEKPARALFRDFDSTSRFVSAQHYRQNLGLAAADSMLKPACNFFEMKPAAHD